MILHLKLLVPAAIALSAAEVDLAATSARALALSKKNNKPLPTINALSVTSPVAPRADSRTILNGCTRTYHLMKTARQRHLAHFGHLIHSVRQVRPVRRPSLPILLLQPVSIPRTVLGARITVRPEILPWLRTFTLLRFHRKTLKNPIPSCLVSKYLQPTLPKHGQMLMKRLICACNKATHRSTSFQPTKC